MIVDAHAHWGPWFFSMTTGDPRLNTTLLDRFGIDIQLVSATEGVVYDAPLGNASLESVLSSGIEPRLRGLVVIDPRDLSSAARDLERLRRPTWVGAKIHTHYSATPVASPRMADAVRLATEAGLPVLVHTWGSDLIDLADLAARVPGSRLVAGHMGAGAWRLAGAAAERSENVWFEPCWSQPEAGRVRWVVDTVGAHRLLFGSDATLIDPSVTLGAVLAAGLDAAERCAVMGENAARLYDLG